MEIKTRDELREIRRQLGLTQADIARACKITPQTVLKWEAGKGVHPSTDYAIRAEIAAKMRLYKSLMGA